ncbi:MAG: alcohol dehydrogenase catalytic domain-containing protein [Actinomycetales bacterium]|nr:alcohol dehydrogenase catalytic domain-containing protein [Actinomycetales bacterium]
MRAVVLNAAGAPLQVQDLPEPTAPHGGCVIDVLACGICHSDLHAAAGDYPTALPIVLGHEVAGHHPTLGPVLVYACWGCRQPDCWACGSAQEMICPNATEAGLLRDGGYATRMAVPDEAYLVPLDGLDPVQAAPLACGGLTAYRAVDHALGVLQGARQPRALVIGAGGLGQFGLQWLKIRSRAEVTVVDASAEKRALALQLGADAVAAPGEVEGTFTAVVDFVGAEATLITARDHVARQGLVVVVGLYGGRIPFGFGAVPHEARFMTSVWGSLAQMHEMVALARSHPLHSPVEVIDLADVPAAHARLHRGEVSGRFVIVPREQA